VDCDCGGAVCSGGAGLREAVSNENFYSELKDTKKRDQDEEYY
jgi:hypothetical protein